MGTIILVITGTPREKGRLINSGKQVRDVTSSRDLKSFPHSIESCYGLAQWMTFKKVIPLPFSCPKRIWR